MVAWDIRDTRRWGDHETVQVAAGFGPFVHQTPELIRVEAPAPSCWSIAAILAGVAAADIPGMVLQLVLRMGVGSAQTQVAFTLAPNVLGSAVWIPAKFFTAYITVTAAVAAGGSWQFAAWTAPMVPFDGLRVEPVEYGERGEPR